MRRLEDIGVVGHRGGDQVLRAGGTQEAADAVDVGDVEVGEGFVDEDEAAGACIVHKQPDQQHQRLHDLLAARGLAVVEADRALAIEVEAHLETCVAQREIVVFEVGAGQSTSTPANSPSAFRLRPYWRIVARSLAM